MDISHCKVWLDGFHTNNTKLKKILYFACYDSPFGGSTRTTMYARKLVELGNEVTVVTSSYNHLMKFEKNLNSLYREIDFEGFIKKFSYINKKQPYFIYIPNFIKNLILKSLFKKIHSKIFSENIIINNYKLN